MRQAIMIGLGLAALCRPTGASALQGMAGGHCDGTDHVVSISGWYIEAFDGDFTGLVFVREAIGFCTPAVTVPEEPLPFVPQDTGEAYLVYTATAVLPAPAEAAVYRYTPYAVRPGGGLEPIHAQCDADDRSYALIACAEVPLARGTFLPGPNYPTVTEFQVLNCPDDCWSEGIGVFLDETSVAQVSGMSAWDLLGRTVDVYGTRTWCTMPPGVYHTVTRIVLTNGGGCGPVPAEDASWGGLKATYR